MLNSSFSHLKIPPLYHEIFLLLVEQKTYKDIEDTTKTTPFRYALYNLVDNVAVRFEWVHMLIVDNFEKCFMVDVFEMQD